MIDRKRLSAVSAAFLTLMDGTMVALTGYQLGQRFTRALGEAWQLNRGQAYSTLKRLVAYGWVQADTALTYTVTDEGRREVAQWLNAAGIYADDEHDMLRVRGGFLVRLLGADAAAARAALDREHTRLDAARRALAEHVSTLPPTGSVARRRWLIADYTLAEYAARLAWIEKARSLLPRDTTQAIIGRSRKERSA